MRLEEKKYSFSDFGFDFFSFYVHTLFQVEAAIVRLATLGNRLNNRIYN